MIQTAAKINHSFKYAFEGIWAAILTETNFKLGIFEAFLSIGAGLFFQITTLEWIIVIILIGMVLTAELFNTAIETIVDSFTTAEHPSAKRAKDISAGAVLMVIFTSFLVGLIIFLPYIF